MAGNIIYTHEKFDEDKDINSLSYVNDINYPYKYSVRVYRGGYKICYIASEHELDFSINDYNTSIDSVVVSPKNVSSTNIKSISTSGNTSSKSISSWHVVADVDNEKDAEVRKGLLYFIPFVFDIDAHIDESITPFPINYRVTPSEHLPPGSSFTLVEKINGEIFRTLENQTGATQYTLDVSNMWNDIGYKKNVIEIIATSSIELSSTASTSFTKIKELTKPITTTSSLKEFIDHISNIDKDIDYLNIRLANNLTKKGVEVLPTDKMSTLIGNINNIDSVRFGYGDTLLLTSDNFQTPLSTSVNLKNAYFNTFNVNNIFRNRVDTYTLSMNLSHSTVNKTNFTLIICDSQQTILHEINIPIFKYTIDVSIDLKHLPNDNILGFYMLNDTTSTGLTTKCNLSCDMQFI